MTFPSNSIAPGFSELYYLSHFNARLFAFDRSVCPTLMSSSTFSAFRDFRAFGRVLLCVRQAVGGVGLAGFRVLCGLAALNAKSNTGFSALGAALRS